MPTLEPLLAQKPPLRTDADGTVRVGASRVTFDTVVSFYERGAAPEEIRLRFPSLMLSDIYAVISYYLAHRAQVQSYLDARHEHAQSVRRDIEHACPPDDLHARLVARRNASHWGS